MSFELSDFSVAGSIEMLAESSLGVGGGVNPGGIPFPDFFPSLFLFLEE